MSKTLQNHYKIKTLDQTEQDSITIQTQPIFQVRVKQSLPTTPKIANQQRILMGQLERLGVLQHPNDKPALASQTGSQHRRAHNNDNQFQYQSLHAENNRNQLFFERPQFSYQVNETLQSCERMDFATHELGDIFTSRPKINNVRNNDRMFRSEQATSETSPMQQQKNQQIGLNTHIAYEEYNLPLPVMQKKHKKACGNMFFTIQDSTNQVAQLEEKVQPNSYVERNLRVSRLKTLNTQPRAQMLIPQLPIVQKKVTPEGFLSEVIQTIQSEQKHSQRGKIMEGRCNFKLPDAQTIQKHLKGQNNQVKINFIDQLSQEDDALKGLINIGSSKNRMLVRQPIDKYDEYVQNFCSPGSPIVNKSLIISKPAQSLLQSDIRNTADSPESPRKGVVWNQQNFKFDTSNSLNSQVMHVGQDFLKKMSYIQRFKNQQLDINAKDVIGGGDANIQYFLDCKKDLVRALPILDKIINKKLCLQNYTLLDGHCKSLARAFGLINEQNINGILLANCGIDGKQFGGIIQGLHRITDFKSITYKQNMFSIESLQAIEPLLQRMPPLNLAELTLIDLKISSKCCEELMLCLQRENFIQKLSLVNLQLTERQFDIFLTMIEKSQYLETLDLSWCEVRHSTYTKLFETLAINTQLQRVALQWNAILEDKEQAIHNLTQLKLGEPESLTPKNGVIVGNICKFITQSPALVLVDLQNAGLSNHAIELICNCLNKAVSIRCIILSGNPGINDSIVEKLRTMLNALPSYTTKTVKNFTKQDEDQAQAQHLKSMQEGMTKMQRRISKYQEIKNSEQSEPTSPTKNVTNTFQSSQILNPDQLQKWIQLQEGIKMRNIQQISQIKDLKLGVISTDRHHLTVFRKIGFAPFVENANSWQINDSKQECYITDQHMFTIFIWSQRIGATIGSSSDNEVKYYKDQVGNYMQNDNFQTAPQILGTFNDWQPKQMVSLMQFCMDNDQIPPDFVGQLIEEGKSRVQQPDLMDEQEAKALQEKRELYYRQEPLNILKNISPFKHPQFALIDQIDANQMQQMVEENSTQSRLWLWMDFVKPGRHTFCVRTPAQNEAGVKTRAGFYVHKMLGQIRTEDFPMLRNTSS